MTPTPKDQAKTAIFTALRRSCGMSLMEIAIHFGVRAGTAQSWENGRRIPPDEVLGRLSEIFLRIEAHARGQRSAPDNLPRGCYAAIHRRQVELSITTEENMLKVLIRPKPKEIDDAPLEANTSQIK